MPSLKIKDPGGRVRSFFFKERALIGRNHSNDVQLNDVSSSRHHAVVYQDRSGRFVVEDLNSRNGLLIGKGRVRRLSLSEGTTFKIGGSYLQFSRMSRSLEGDAFVTHARLLSDEDPKRAMEDLLTMYELGNMLHSAATEKELYQSIAALVLQTTGAEQVSVVEVDLEGELVEKVTMSIPGLALDGFSYSKTVLEEVLAKGKTVLVSDAEFEGLSASKSMVSASIRSVLCAPLRSRDRTLGMVFAAHRGVEFSFDDYQRKQLTAVGLQAGIAVENHQLAEVRERSFLITVEALANALDAKDAYTVGHSRRVANLSVEIGRHLDLTTAEVKTLYMGALLHDIGKIGLDDALLKGTKIFEPEDRTEAFLHTVNGEKILKPLEGATQIKEIVRSHHERWDGAGYPDKLKGEEIPLMARIVAVADTLDAINSDRPYHKGQPFEEALKEIKRCSGGQFDSRVVKALLRAVESGRL